MSKMTIQEASANNYRYWRLGRLVVTALITSLLVILKLTVFLDMSYWVVFGPYIYNTITSSLYYVVYYGVHSALIADDLMFQQREEEAQEEQDEIDKCNMKNIDPSLLKLFPNLRKGV